jgi:uncharacterized protein YecT (DUF1311 family)
MMKCLEALLITVMFSAQAYATPASIDPLAGAWQVKHVGIDDWISSHISVSPDDPLIVGRRVIITADKISAPMSQFPTCLHPELDAGAALSLDKLIELTSGERETEPLLPIAKDFDLSLRGTQKVTPLTLKCKTGSFAEDGEKIKAWMIMTDENTLIMPGNMNVYLTLKRLPTDIKPAPSFNCSKAAKPAERAICNSFDLAAWDVSVNDAFRTVVSQATEVNPNDHQTISTIKKQQNAWIAQRNKCGNDSQCLYKSMISRVETLNDDN